MNMSPTARGPSRFTGIALVVLIHAVMAVALIQGLMRQPAEAPPPPITLYPDKKTTPPEPPPPLPLPQPTLKLPSVPMVPAPELPPIQLTAAQTITSAVAPDSGTLAVGTDVTTASAGSASRPLPAAASGPVNPGAICTRMASPQAPSVNWSGEALFKVTATVKAGRVAATEIRVLRGSFDSRTRRALQAAIDTTLRDGYECPGDHQFEQEFNFRIE